MAIAQSSATPQGTLVSWARASVVPSALPPRQAANSARPPTTRRSEAAFAEPPATSWHQGFRGTVDYVLYEAAALRPTALLPTPGWATLESLGGALPTAAHPSDHVPVAADLAWVADAPAAPEGAPALPPPEPGVIAATAAMVSGENAILL